MRSIMSFPTKKHCSFIFWQRKCRELSKYKEQVKKKLEQWDELEKSIVASIADELVVGARNNYVDLIAVKKFK